MPSQQEPPDLQQLIDAYRTGAAIKDTDADRHDGSRYEDIGGPGALLMQRVAHRMRSGFRENYLRSSSRRLDQQIVKRFGTARVEGTPGQGTITVSRAAATAGAGTFRKGTRFRVGVSEQASKRYQVTADTPAGASDLEATIPVEAGFVGPEGEIEGTGYFLRFEDFLWDNTWQIDSIDVAKGTDRQEDEDYLESVKDERFLSRPGYEPGIETALRAAGATQIVFFPSDFAGEALDYGLNYIVLGDDGYEASNAMLLACRLTLDSVTMGGSSVQVVPMTRTTAYINAVVHLWDLPEKFDREGVAAATEGAILEYFRARENPFLWKESSIRGAVWRSTRNVQKIDLTVSASKGGSAISEPSLATLFQSTPISRYVAETYSIDVAIDGPA